MGMSEKKNLMEKKESGLCGASLAGVIDENEDWNILRDDWEHHKGCRGNVEGDDGM